MKQHLKGSLRTIISNFVYVLILSLGGVTVSGGGFFALALLAISIGVLFLGFPAIYGRLAEMAAGKQNTPYLQLIRKFTLRYLAVSLVILLLPGYLLASVSRPEFMSVTVYRSISFTLKAVIGSLTIYIFPCLFLTGRVIPSITGGIRFFFRNALYSAPLVLLTLLILAVKTSVNLFIPAHLMFPTSSGDIISINPLLVSLPKNIITVFISLVIFTTACRVLLEKGEVEH